ncbi:hypothetical protein Tco_1231326, partial [Tanacetum coccineum]
HKPFAFGEFGISELDELREIIPKKKNAVVQDLMNSLSRRYERIRKILEELGIKSVLLAPAHEQASSKSSRKKRKHMELEPGIKIPGLECNRALPKNVLFVNNMVIKGLSMGYLLSLIIKQMLRGRMIPTLPLKILHLTLRGRLMQTSKKSMRNLSTQLMPTLGSLVHLNLNP